MPKVIARKCSRIALLMLLSWTFNSAILAQKKSVSGIVTDAISNLPIAGVSVSLTNSSTGTVTDSSGRYAIMAISGSKINFTHTGFITQTVIVPLSGYLDIRLESSTKGMDEVVVIGYGQARKKDLTGAIVQIKPDKIADQNPNNVQDILRGTPGLSIGFDPSAKGGGSILIRGQRSVYTDGGHNDPLIILDGMIFYGEFSELNPDDIEQIDVLKDASAAAVYGARSANGVIIVTTRKGKAGKPKINLTSNLGLVTMAASRPVFSPQGYLQYRQDWYTAASYGLNSTNGNYEPYLTGVSANKPGYYEQPTTANLVKSGITIDQWRAYTLNASGISDNEIWGNRIILQDVTLKNFLGNKTYDWYKHSFQTGVNQDHNISLSGGSDRMNYYLSGGYLSNQGVVVGNKYSAIRANMKLEGKVNSWLTIGANVNFQNRTDGDLTADWSTQILNNSPFANYADSTGKPAIHPMGDLTNNKGYNYDFDKQYRALERGYTVLNTIFNAKIKLPFNINYTFNISPRYQWYYNRYFESYAHPDWSPLTHGVTREQSKRFDWSLNNTLYWEHIFANRHKLQVTLVQEAENRQYWYDGITALNIQPTDALGFHETRTGDINRSSFNSDDSKETADALMGRLFYSFDDRYMLTASVRRDGYSAFASTSHPRGTFFSTAVAWTFTNEKFFHWKPLNFGKLRLSWGQNGNRSLADPYLALANLGAGVGATQGYLDANGNYVQYRYFIVDRLANPNLRWERTRSSNAGIDLGFVNNKVTTTFDYYIAETTDMIMNQSIPGFSGFTNITTNLGQVQNRGFEITVTSQNIQSKNFTWSSTIGFSKYKNTIQHLYYVYKNGVEVSDTANAWFIGQPINSIWDYNVTGVWQKNEAAQAALYGQRPGDPKVANNFSGDDVKNANGSVTPVYNNRDKIFLGQTSPPIMWSFRNDFTFFKNLTVSVNMYAYMGHKSLNGAYLNQDNGTSQVTNDANSYAKQYWTLDNPSNVFGRLDAKGPAGLSAPNRLIDRSFIRLDNFTIGYTIPGRFTSKYKIEKFKVFGSVRNIAAWKKDKSWEYWDIETGTYAPRIYNLGLNVTF